VLVLRIDEPSATCSPSPPKIIPYSVVLAPAGFGEHVAEGSSIRKTSTQNVVPATQPWPDVNVSCWKVTSNRPYLVAAQTRLGKYLHRRNGGAGRGHQGRARHHAEARRTGPGSRPCLRKGRGADADQPRISLHDSTGQAICRAFALVGDARSASKQFGCAFSAVEPGLLDGHCADFQPDWKDAEGAHSHRPSIAPTADDRSTFLPRGHATIDAETGVARDQDLYVEVPRGVLLADGFEAPLPFHGGFRRNRSPLCPGRSARRWPTSRGCWAPAWTASARPGRASWRGRISARRSCRGILGGTGQERQGNLAAAAGNAGILVDPDDPGSPHKSGAVANYGEPRSLFPARRQPAPICAATMFQRMWPLLSGAAPACPAAKERPIVRIPCLRREAAFCSKPPRMRRTRWRNGWPGSRAPAFPS